MKKFFLTLACALLTLPIFARDFSYTYEGQTLTYTVISEEEKTVMTKAGNESGAGNVVNGNLIIPERVSDAETEYTVRAIGKYSFLLCEDLIYVTIPNTVNLIDSYAFDGCFGLTSITIPPSVTRIGSGAFYACHGFTSITIPDSITEIPYEAFAKCIGLISINIPNSVTTIGESAFDYCINLPEIYIPASVSQIGESVLGRCFALTEINVDKNNEYYCTYEGVLYNKNKTELLQCPAGKTGSFNVPTTVTSIWGDAFDNCTELTSITIPNSVSLIGQYAFLKCIGLTSINIPTSLTSISFGMFSDCTGLTSITIPNSVDTIEGYAFDDCSSLVSIKLPYTLKTIEQYVFSGCTSLTSISIPSSVEEIYHSAFYKCSSLKTIYYNTENPIYPESETSHINNKSVFGDEVYENATLYVPAGTVVRCKEIEPWKNFMKIEAYDFSGVDEIWMDNESLDAGEIYTLSGVKVTQAKENLTPGIYIIRSGKEVKKVVVK